MSTTLRDYQRTTLDQIAQLYSAGHTRVTVALPCGTGKTVLAAHLIRQTGGRTLVFVPTVELLAQTIRRLGADNPGVPIVAVCSDVAIGDGLPQHEEAEARGQEITTDPTVLAAQITRPKIIVVSTYASAPTLVTATGTANVTWDLVVCDEAHRTAGLSNRQWSLPVHDEHLPAHRRLFLTATTRTVQPPPAPDELPDPADVEVVSMDSLENYGPHVAPITLREAIDDGILSDYEVAIIGVPDTAVLNLIADTPTDTPLAPYDAATHLALLHAQDTHPELQSILAFHNRVKSSRQWSRQLRALAVVDGREDSTEVYHVDGTTDSRWRTRALNHLAHPGDGMVIVSNCRLFSEGVDVPALDGVLFAAPRTSTEDIVQIVGRALRPHPQRAGRKALIVLPVIHTGEDDRAGLSAIAHSTHLAAWQVLMSLSEVDEQIYRSVARLQMDVLDDAPVGKRDTSTVTVDTSMLAEGASIPFTLHTLSPVTAHHPQTVAFLRSWLSVKGHANPPVKAVWRDYPLGRRVASVRQAKREGRLEERIVEMYENIPGFEWEPPRRTVGRSTDRWIDLMERYLAATGVRSIEPFSTVMDPDTGEKVAIGRKLHDYKWVTSLGNAQRDRLRDLGIRNAPAHL